MLFFAQTDTTAGFLSTNPNEILAAKKIPKSRPILQEVDKIARIREISRIPKCISPMIRRAQKTTFIFPNTRSFRLISESSLHFNVISRFKILFSSSANITGGEFSEDYALKNASVVIKDERGFAKRAPSRIFRVKKDKLKRIR